jgi:hypothetical protein
MVHGFRPLISNGRVKISHPCPNQETRTITSEQTKALRDHFMTWSGGFRPESGNEISIYVEGSLGIVVDPSEAVDELLRWLQ